MGVDPGTRNSAAHKGTIPPCDFALPERVAGMSINHDDVLRAALQLPESERMLLAEELIESVPEPEEPDVWSEPELLAVLTAACTETLGWTAGPQTMLS